MPKRKRKPAPKRTRRSPYERSLEHATNRLEKALGERIVHQAALEALSTEIPHLEGIIRALEPTVAAPLFAKVGLPPRRVTDQSLFLTRFVKPLDTNTMRTDFPDIHNQEPDPEEPFLPGIGGTEILP